MSGLHYEFPGGYPQQHVHLSFDKQDFCKPNFVLVFAFHQNKLLFTHNRLRGWELPGGACKKNEWPVKAAIREVYEETGAELASLTLIGQYIIKHPQETRMVKSIYIADIQALHPIPPGFETDDRILLNPPSPDSILQDACFSPILKDGVYRYTLPVALDRAGLLLSQNLTSSLIR